VVPAEPAPAERLSGADMITFTSASTVENFVTLAGDRVRTLLDRTAVAVIGPVTAAALERIGVAPDVMPREYTIEALVAAIVAYFASREAVV